MLIIGLLWNPTDIQEFYELTLLDETKTVHQKTQETLQMATKWEANPANSNRLVADDPPPSTCVNDYHPGEVSLSLFSAFIFANYSEKQKKIALKIMRERVVSAEAQTRTNQAQIPVL